MVTNKFRINHTANLRWHGAVLCMPKRACAQSLRLFLSAPKELRISTYNMGKSSTGGRNLPARCDSGGSRRRGCPPAAVTPAAPHKRATASWSSAFSKIGGTKTTATPASSAASPGAERAGQEIGGQVASRRRVRWEGATGRPQWRRRRRERSVKSATAAGELATGRSVERTPAGEVAGLCYRRQESSPPGREISMDSPAAAGKTPSATDLVAQGRK
jgi:hypothetical protein